MSPLKSIAEELSDCRAAFAAHPTATWAWCCHHEIHAEPLTEPAATRINYILSDKPKREQAIRLRNFRPVRVELPGKLAKAEKAYNEAEKAYNEAEKARNEAEKAYNEARKACDEAEKARNEACKARDAARKACEPELKQLHDEDWENSWNGESIFN